MKTVFFKSLKLFMFLLFAALGSNIGLAQTIQHGPIITPIGGSKTPDTGGYANNRANIPPLIKKEFNIGGRSIDPGTSPKSNSTGFVSNLAKGGRNSDGSVLISNRQTDRIILKKGSNSQSATNGLVIGGKDKPEPSLFAFKLCGSSNGQSLPKQPSESFFFRIDHEIFVQKETVFPLIV